jgi:hypothetical protein
MSASSKQVFHAFEWTSYSVSRSDKEPLLKFVTTALEMRECRVAFASKPDRAPFYIVFETAGGERHGLLVYAFFANSQKTNNRPSDERRFQIKYGGDLKSILDVSIDPKGLITTIFIGIDLAQNIFVAADPLMNSPSPMSRSIEFKNSHFDSVRESGWAAWERDRRPGKSKDRATAEIEDLRTEVLIGGRQDRLLDLVSLERIAQGLDPGERHLVADKLRTPAAGPSPYSHAVLKEFDLEPQALFDLIEGAGRLKMAVRGWVAEQHLYEQLAAIEGVTDCTRLGGDGQPDLTLRWRGGEPILVECKNTLRTPYADGRPKVDFQRTRASKGDPCSRYYKASDFPVLAACLHAVTERWEFRFALTTDLEPHKSCEGRISSNIAVGSPLFVEQAAQIFNAHYARLAQL